MNSKGFTLVELVAIILILALIFLIALPYIVNSSKENKEKEYNNMVKTLCLAGESYIDANIDLFEEYLQNEGNIITIEISDLIEYGNVEAKTKNPKTDKSVKDDTLSFTVQNDKSLDCSYNEKNNQ